MGEEEKEEEEEEGEATLLSGGLLLSSPLLILSFEVAAVGSLGAVVLVAVVGRGRGGAEGGGARESCISHPMMDLSTYLILLSATQHKEDRREGC